MRNEYRRREKGRGEKKIDLYNYKQGILTKFNHIFIENFGMSNFTIIYKL